jgi:DNA-binding transcriptional ArsR family regulator
MSRIPPFTTETTAQAVHVTEDARGRIAAAEIVTVASLAKLAALVGNPARAGMLMALMGGRALSATELAHVAGISPQTASGHLGQLSTGRLLCTKKQGRHRYHRLASPEVTLMLKELMRIATVSDKRRSSCKEPELVRSQPAKFAFRRT